MGNNNKKLYKILSYVGILWIIGLLVPEKDDIDLKFHVGQGMILTIAMIALNIAVAIVNVIIAIIVPDFIGFIQTLLTSLIQLAAWVAIIALMVIGIMNANKGEEKLLPIIGQYAFYK